MFGVDRHCVSGDIIGSVCPAILLDHIVKGNMTLWVESHQPAKFGCPRHCGSGDMMVST